MRAPDRLMARKSLDKKLNSIRNSEFSARPSRGWIKAIREALGMTTTQLGDRMGVRQSTALGFEKAEQRSAISLETLERAAAALDCRLFYALVPRKPLEELVEDRALSLAKRHLYATSHSMALEGQRVAESDEREQFERLVRSLVEKGGSQLWEDP